MHSICGVRDVWNRFNGFDQKSLKHAKLKQIHSCFLTSET